MVLDVFKVNASYDFREGLGNGLDRLPTKLVKWNRGAYLFIDEEGGYPVLYAPNSMYYHDLSNLVKRAASVFTAYQNKTKRKKI